MTQECTARRARSRRQGKDPRCQRVQHISTEMPELQLRSDSVYVGNTSAISAPGLDVLVSAPRQEFKNQKVGTSGARRMNATIGQRWQCLSAEAKQAYQLEANRVQEARKDVLSQPLKDREEHASLRPSQLHRLNNARLDTSLRAVAHHQAWRSGLQLKDHVAALKPEHVLGDVDEKEMSRMYRDIFSYDSTVQPNPELPRYEQPCTSTGGGICRSHEHFASVDHLVRQLDAGILAAKLRDTPALVCLSSGIGQQWMLVGCTGLRPMVHTVLCLQTVEAENLTITVENTRPKLTTSHRLFFTLLQQLLADGRTVADCRFEAGFCEGVFSMVVAEPW